MYNGLCDELYTISYIIYMVLSQIRWNYKYLHTITLNNKAYIDNSILHQINNKLIYLLKDFVIIELLAI